MIGTARKISKESVDRIRLLGSFPRRAHATSTMCTVGSYAANCSERTATIPSPKKDFSTQVEHIGETCRNIMEATASRQASHLDGVSNDLPGFGVEMSIEQANVAAEMGSFDKILLLMGHGDADYPTRSDGEVDGDLSLTSKGFGQALSVSGETAVHCYESDGSRLSPDLFVISPLRCAAESLLVAFPYYSPDSIYSKKWVCHGSCMDDKLRTPVNILEKTFPGIDFSTADDKSDFLTWLGTREERIIAVASTPSWINSFCGTSDLGGKYQGLRAVGIKFL